MGARGMLRQPVRRRGWVRGRTFWMLPSTVEGRDGASTRGVVRAPSLMSSRSMSARIASRGPARSSHVAWMRALAASKRLGDAISWRGRSSARAREFAADSSDRIAASCRRHSLTSASASDSAARAAAASRCRSLSATLLLRRRRRRWRRAAAFCSLTGDGLCSHDSRLSTVIHRLQRTRARVPCGQVRPHAAVAVRSGEQAGRRGVGGGATGR